MTYQMKEVAKKTGLSIPTLRYYEELGLLQPQRLENGYRVYQEKDLEWIQFIIRLKETGMSLKKITFYAALRSKGDETIDERITLLAQQEALLLEKQQELQTHLNFLQQKQAIYHTMKENLNRK